MATDYTDLHRFVLHLIFFIRENLCNPWQNKFVKIRVIRGKIFVAKKNTING